MQIQVNGDNIEVPAGTSIAALLQSMDLGERRVAVELNLEIVPRSQHDTTELNNGDRVEVVHAIGGG